MKQCSTCKETKEYSAFRKRAAVKDGLSSQCKACLSQRDRNDYVKSEKRRLAIRKANNEKRIKTQKFIREYLQSHPCVDCGQTDADLLEFDHITDKTMGIAVMVQRGYSIAKIVDEIAKCQVRCLYCHRKKTIKQLGWYSWMNDADNS